MAPRKALTPNQIVAANLALAREMNGWTQEQAAKEMAPYLGKQWSKATFSVAERSVDGERIRDFSADELLAFSRAFGLPVTWFLIPPEPTAEGEDVPGIAAADAGPRGHELSLLIERLYGTWQEREWLIERLQRLSERAQLRFDDLPEELRTGLAYPNTFEQVYVDELRRWRQSLLDVAGRVEIMERLGTEAIIERLSREEAETVE